MSLGCADQSCVVFSLLRIRLLLPLAVSVDYASYSKDASPSRKGWSFVMITRLLLVSPGDAPWELETITQQIERFSYVIHDKESSICFCSYPHRTTKIVNT